MNILSLCSTVVMGSSLLLAAACASGAANDGTTGTTSSSSTLAAAEPAALTGTWGFVLASSDVAGPLRERCAASSGSDAAKSAACWNEVATQAGHEKIRFTPAGAGTTWTSFETDGQHESVYVEVPVQLAADGPNHVLAKVAGEPKGEHAARFAKASINVMRIEVVDAKTIAMIDPEKGRLVYVKE